MEHNELVRRRMKKMLIGVGILFGAIFIYKLIGSLLLKHYMANQSHVVSVTVTTAKTSVWKDIYKASASLRAIEGVNVTTQIAGMVQTIYFTPGAMVKKGDVLVQLVADNDIARLHSLQANADLALLTYNRDKAQYAVHAISKQTLDIDAANLRSLEAQVAEQAAIVAKKTIQAPFTGRLGIRLVNPGQYLNPGDPVAMLQTLDPVYVNFYVPEQAFWKMKVGIPINMIVDAFPGQVFKGKITTVNPGLDPSTRNVLVEATVSNPKYELAPGMFATVEVILGKENQYLTLPQVAISFNPYGEMVYVLHPKDKNQKTKDGPLIAVQTFVKTGETRGDQIAVLSGIKAGDVVVTTGQLKLKNGTEVNIVKEKLPIDSPAPAINNEHT